MSTSRRQLLQAAAFTPVAAALPAGVSVPLSARDAAATGSYRPDVAVPRFTIAVLPDTQYLFDEASPDPQPLATTFAYLLAERAADNIVFMTHLGDVTEHGSATEIDLAARTFDRGLGRNLPYSVLAGNHDVRSSTDDQRGPTPYLSAFGPARFNGMPTFGGSSPDGYNSYHRLRAGGREWIVLALDWRASDAGLAWAQDVVRTHPTSPVLLTTHDLVSADAGDGVAVLSPNGKRLWDKLIRGNDQIFLTLNGHYWPPGRAVLTNDAGHAVHAHITNYQDRYYGGAGMIRLYHFDLARNVIDVETLSPWFLARDPAKRNPLTAQTLELTGDVDRFSIRIDFAARFAGFDGLRPRDARPAAAVMPPGTVAYWRFDGAGLSNGSLAAGGAVPAGAVARDLTGRGNDLVARLVNGSDPTMLTWSDDHHPDQPAHASLRFDGGQSPNRCAILEAVAAAPVNRANFVDGFTIEAFVKLPDPFVGNHDWMGVLSWEGRSAEAAAKDGDPDEPTCSLNLSPERFAQFVLYPTNTTTNPTNWSHALPIGRWIHLAVVNDGRRTSMYVDGSLIVRNPTVKAIGITTLGHPFVIGATQYAGLFDQGFYGWIGDVRISDRPLQVKDFLTG